MCSFFPIDDASTMSNVVRHNSIPASCASSLIWIQNLESRRRSSVASSTVAVSWMMPLSLALSSLLSPVPFNPKIRHGWLRRVKKHWQGPCWQLLSWSLRYQLDRWGRFTSCSSSTITRCDTDDVNDNGSGTLVIIDPPYDILPS